MSLNLIAPVHLLVNASLGDDLESRAVHIMYSDNVGIQISWTGTPTGDFGVELSNDATLDSLGTVSGGTWTPMVLTFPNSPSASGSDGNGFISLNQVPAAFIRLTYSSESGSGACNAYLTAKPV